MSGATLVAWLVIAIRQSIVVLLEKLVWIAVTLSRLLAAIRTRTARLSSRATVRTGRTSSESESPKSDSIHELR